MRNTHAIGNVQREMYVRFWRMSGRIPPGSHVARARTETSIPGFRWDILAGYLWKLNPPVYQSSGKLRPPSTSMAFRRVSNGLLWWSPFIKCPLSKPLGELSLSLSLSLSLPLSPGPPRLLSFSSSYFATSCGFSTSFFWSHPRPYQTSFLRILS